MRKIKKINGFLVVKFNDREKREYEGTALGEYGVIDAEVYTGNLDIDRGAMEYDDADTLEVAVELARGLESEEDITDEPPTYTAAVETNESYTEEAVEPAALIEGWTRRLATRVKSKHYPDTDPRTAAHELYGFKMALHQIGFLPESEVITDPDTFGAGRLDGPMPRNPEELLAFVCDERCKNRAGHTQEELDAICAKCPLGQLYEDAEAQDLRIRERSERALREHIEGVRHAEDTLTALLGGHEALAYLAALRDGQILQENECEHYAAQIAEAGAAWETVLEGVSFEDLSRLRHLLREVDEYQATLGQQETIELTREKWLSLTNGQHQLRIEAVDGNFATSVRVFSFSKKETVIKFELAAPEETDAAATKVLVTPTWKIEGAVAKVEACNNGFDAVPTWEDITAMVQINRVYNFTNKTKTASKWGVNIRFTITKNEGFEGEVSISGFGGAYE